MYNNFPYYGLSREKMGVIQANGSKSVHPLLRSYGFSLFGLNNNYSLISEMVLSIHYTTYFSADILGDCRRVHDCFFPCGPRRLKTMINLCIVTVIFQQMKYMYPEYEYII